MITDVNTQGVKIHVERKFTIFFREYISVVALWIRELTLNREVPGSKLLAAAVVSFDKALYPHCLVPRKGLKTVGPPGWLLAYKQWPGKILNKN